MTGFGPFSPGQDWQPFGMAWFVPAFLRRRRLDPNDGPDSEVRNEILSGLHQLNEKLLALRNSRLTALEEADVDVMIERADDCRQLLEQGMVFTDTIATPETATQVQIESLHAYDQRILDVIGKTQHALRTDRHGRTQIAHARTLMDEMSRLVARRKEVTRNGTLE